MVRKDLKTNLQNISLDLSHVGGWYGQKMFQTMREVVVLLGRKAGGSPSRNQDNPDESLSCHCLSPGLQEVEERSEKEVHFLSQPVSLKTKGTSKVVSTAGRLRPAL